MWNNFGEIMKRFRFLIVLVSFTACGFSVQKHSMEKDEDCGTCSTNQVVQSNGAEGAHKTADDLSKFVGKKGAARGPASLNDQRSDCVKVGKVEKCTRKVVRVDEDGNEYFVNIKYQIVRKELIDDEQFEERRKNAFAKGSCGQFENFINRQKKPFKEMKNGVFGIGGFEIVRDYHKIKCNSIKDNPDFGYFLMHKLLSQRYHSWEQFIFGKDEVYSTSGDENKDGFLYYLAEKIKNNKIDLSNTFFGSLSFSNGENKPNHFDLAKIIIEEMINHRHSDTDTHPGASAFDLYGANNNEAIRRSIFKSTKQRDRNLKNIFSNIQINDEVDTQYASIKN